MQAFIHQPFSFDDSLNIRFKNNNEAVRIILENINDNDKKFGHKIFCDLNTPSHKIRS